MDSKSFEKLCDQQNLLKIWCNGHSKKNNPDKFFKVKLVEKLGDKMNNNGHFEDHYKVEIKEGYPQLGGLNGDYPYFSILAISQINDAEIYE